MVQTLEPDVREEEQAMSLIRAISVARGEARKANFDVQDRRLFIVERSDENEDYWSINFVHPNYINRRGGGFEVRVAAVTGEVISALRTQ